MFHSTNAPVRTRTSVREGLLAYVTFGPRAQGTVNGLAVLPGLMLAAEPGTEARFVVEAGWESITFLVRAQDIRGTSSPAGARQTSELPSGVETLQVNAERVRALYDWGKRLVDIAARAPAIFDEGRKERIAAQVELLETLLATLRRGQRFRAHAQRPDAAGAQPHRQGRRGPRAVAGATTICM